MVEAIMVYYVVDNGRQYIVLANGVAASNIDPRGIGVNAPTALMYAYSMSLTAARFI
jgi:hypothetical protein